VLVVGQPDVIGAAQGRLATISTGDKSIALTVSGRPPIYVFFSLSTPEHPSSKLNTTNPPNKLFLPEN
jgi:hypothetical protein